MVRWHYGRGMSVSGTSTDTVSTSSTHASLDLKITVAISTRNRGALIDETLQKLLQLTYPHMEVLIVDQSTDDRTRQTVGEVAAGDPRVQLTPSNTVGLPVGRNLALSGAHGDVIAYTDDDCIVSDDWLDALAREFQDPQVAAVFGRLLPWEGAERTGIETGYKPTLERVVHERPTPPWWVGHGGNMAFRRDVLLAMGGFDPLLGAGCPLRSGEDSDIIHRLLREKKRIVYCPEALAYHKQWKSWVEQTAMERAYGIGVGAQCGKYIRSGDADGYRFLSAWVWQLGVRRMAAGVLKWRNPKVVHLGYCQLIYPWVGIWKSLRHKIDRTKGVYIA